jgi:hypothetical protein
MVRVSVNQVPSICAVPYIASLGEEIADDIQLMECLGGSYDRYRTERRGDFGLGSGCIGKEQA